MSEPIGDPETEFRNLMAADMAEVNICLMWMADGQVYLGSPNGSASPAELIASLRFLANEMEAGRGQMIARRGDDG